MREKKQISMSNRLAWAAFTACLTTNNMATKQSQPQSVTASQSASAKPQKPAPGKEPVSGSVDGSAIAALTQDHRRVEQLFADYERASESGRKDALTQQICVELAIHTKLEEEIFYPAYRAAIADDDILDEAQVEHDSAKLLIANLLESRYGDRFRDAKISVLREHIKHHVSEEEKPDLGIFVQAKVNNVDSTELAERLRRRKQNLQGRAADLWPIRAVSIDLNLDPYQEETMPRYSYDRDRDERGRFMSEDDDRDDRRAGYRGGGGRRYDKEDDDDRRGRSGWYGDPEGHSQAARRRWDEDDDYRRGPRSRSEDEDYRSSYRGGGRERDERGRFMSDDDEDDRRYRSYRGRERDEDDDRGYRDRGHGGWYGDPEGHAEAARERWREERGSRSRSRYDDDDEYDRRSRSRSRGEGHGGWFGDSRGHAQAARRGWDHRR
jgi:hypothetical protein